MEEAWFLTYTAANHQGEIKLHFWEAGVGSHKDDTDDDW